MSGLVVHWCHRSEYLGDYSSWVGHSPGRISAKSVDSFPRKPPWKQNLSMPISRLQEVLESRLKNQSKAEIGSFLMVCNTITFQLRQREIFSFLVSESPEKHVNVETPGWLYFSKKPLFIREPPCEFHRTEIVPSMFSV